MFFIFCFVSLGLNGCEDTDIALVTEAGIDAIQAVTLSDEAVQAMARKSSTYADSQHRIAPPADTYAKRLKRLVGEHQNEGTIDFNYKVYLAPEANAFAMADGSIRIYSGLMDMLDDGELRFVIGHEMGHVTLKHIHKKLQVAYASNAARKAIASLNNTAGDIASSQLGGFVQTLLGAQFSQLEEKEADDYGLKFMKKKGYAPDDAVSALKKLATLGSDHNFLSSHPEPEKRAERLKMQLSGQSLSIEEQKQSISSKIKTIFISSYEMIRDVLRWLVNFF